MATPTHGYCDQQLVDRTKLISDMWEVKSGWIERDTPRSAETPKVFKLVNVSTGGDIPTSCKASILIRLVSHNRSTAIVDWGLSPLIFNWHKLTIVHFREDWTVHWCCGVVTCPAINTVGALKKGLISRCYNRTIFRFVIFRTVGTASFMRAPACWVVESETVVALVLSRGSHLIVLPYPTWLIFQAESSTHSSISFF